MKIEITTLGRFSVRVNDLEVPEFSAQPVRSSLLVYLAVAGEASRDTAMSLLWPDSDTSRARHALRQNLYELKRTFGQGWLEIHGELLRVGGTVHVDAVDFKQAAEDAAYDEALEIYTGPFLDGRHLGASLEFQHWVDSEREMLSGLFGKVCRSRVEACLAIGNRAGALDAAGRWSIQDPLDAEAQHLLISLLLEDGDPHGALRHYRRYEARLRREELEPLPASIHLLERIQHAAQRASAGPAVTPGTAPPDGFEATLSLSGRPLARRELQPHELCLRGFQYANRRTHGSLKEAVRLFQEALGLQPDFPRAYAGLAYAYAVMPGFLGAQPGEWYPKAKHAAQRALALDPDLAEAHTAMAICALHLDWDLALTEQHLRQALDLAPSYAPAWVRLGYVLCTLGQFHAAREAGNRGLALDPLSVATNFDVGFQAWQLRDRDRAVCQFRRVQELDPGFDPAHFFLGGHHLLLGDVPSAQREWWKIESHRALWAKVVEWLHRPRRAVEALDRLVELAPGPTHYFMVAATYALLGADERALHWLQGHDLNLRGEAGRLETGGPSLTHIVQDPFFDRLRSHERFKALIRGMGLETIPIAPAPRQGRSAF